MTVSEPDWNHARRLAHAAGQPLPTEDVALAKADRRVIASDAHARTALPPRDASAMDGWAVCSDGPWTVMGETRAGTEPAPSLSPGETVAIATGAAIPPGTTGVVRAEDATVLADGRVAADTATSNDIRRAGEEVQAGELLVPAGTRLTPAHLGLLAAAGHDRVLLARRPRALCLVFGDELVRAGDPRDGKVRDSLGPQVPAWLTRLGVEVVDVQWVSDAEPDHVAALRRATDVDVLVTSGGTAHGPVDHVRTAVAQAGAHVVVDTVAVRPGHPMLLAQWGDSRWLVGLPGNPQAAIAALLTLGAPLVAALLGQPLPSLGSRQITEYATARGPATRLIPCTSVGGRCTPTRHIGSGMLRGLAGADGFAVIPPAGAVRGDEVSWLPLPA